MDLPIAVPIAPGEGALVLEPSPPAPTDPSIDWLVVTTASEEADAAGLTFPSLGIEEKKHWGLIRRNKWIL